METHKHARTYARTHIAGGEYVKGWNTEQTDWVPPYTRDYGEDIIANNTDWPSVEWHVKF